LAAVFSVVSSLLVGTILVVAPWTGLWESNYLLAPHPALRSFLLSAFTRGSISGLGLINILLALHEARQRFARRAAEGEGGDRA
jgi:hypothetical protein